MAFAGILLLTLSQLAAQSPSSGATIHAGGHTYQLFCVQEGELIRASETGVCLETDAGGVEHIEIRNEEGDAQFSEDAPEGKRFAYAAIFSAAGAGRAILDVDTSLQDTQGGGPKSAHEDHYFDLTASGMVPFSPALVGVDGFAQLSTGPAISRTFDTGFFQFPVLLGFNTLTHRIEVMTDQPAFSALSPPGRDKAGPSPTGGEIKLYAGHDSSAPKSDSRIVPGHVLTWWQSLDPVEKPAKGQVVTILAAWAPASLKPADSAPEGVQMVYYDWNNLWLQIQVDEHTGWIKGTASFRAIGLTIANAQH